MLAAFPLSSKKRARLRRTPLNDEPALEERQEACLILALLFPSNNPQSLFLFCSFSLYDDMIFCVKNNNLYVILLWFQKHGLQRNTSWIEGARLQIIAVLKRVDFEQDLFLQRRY